MTGKHWVVALLSVLLLPLLAGAVLWWGVNAQLADTRWLDPSVLNNASSVQQAEPADTSEAGDADENEFGESALPEVEDDEGQTQGNQGNVLVDTIREQVAGRLVEAIWQGVLATIVLGIVWTFVVAAKLPSVVGPQSARSLSVPWWGLTLVQIVAVAVLAYLATVSDEVATYLVQAGKLWFSAAIVLILLITWWLASLLATPHRLRPSVPGGNNVPFGME
ncbi:hypothetical protein [Sandarakinorhabdus rubra]|uniref:hypothetical protein n=1 Tax=Sandarakinorhabdus rubra TaxID=2672568 RepID=UPI0013D927AE|nr:hypothetical protein [Sandarakinorhabdus rubra]